MKSALILVQVLSAISICWAQSPKQQARLEAEYYVTAWERLVPAKGSEPEATPQGPQTGLRTQQD